METPTQPQTSWLAELWASLISTIILCIICCALYPLLIWALAQLIFPTQANGSLLAKDGSFTTNPADAVGSALIGQNFSAPQYLHPRPSAAGNGYDPTSSGGTNLGPLSDKLINGATQGSAPTETLAYDGVRLRTLHYALDTGLQFTLYRVNPDGTRNPVPLKQYQDAHGNLNDVKLVDAFPHPPTDTPDRAVLIAADFRHPNGSPVLIPADAVTASASGLDPHISPANAALQAQRITDARKISLATVTTLIDQYTDRPLLNTFGDPGVNVLRLNLALDSKCPLPASK